MTVSAAYVISANSHSAELFRQAAQSYIGGTGVVGISDLEVTENSSPNMSVDVTAGTAWVPGTLSSATGFGTNVGGQTGYGLPATLNEQGCYFVWNNSTVNLTLAAADPTNPRIDLIVAAIQDAQYAGAANQAVLQVITGTAATPPSVPSPPGSCLVLAQIAVAAGATSITTADITDVRPVVTVGADSGWIEVAGGVGFSNGWGQTAEPVAYRRQGSTVKLRGALLPPTGWQTPITAFTLPVGFRPAVDTVQSVTPVSNSANFWYLALNADGTVVPQIGIAGVPQYLDGINFTADS